MAKKIETVYAPFSFSLTDMARQNPVHKGPEGRLLVFKDQLAAYEQWDKLKQIPGPQLSAFGCGSDGSQHVHMPTCTGMIKIEVPRGLIRDDKCICIMNDKLSDGPDDVKINDAWMKQIDIRIEGDVAHGPVLYTQVSIDGYPDYNQLVRLAQLRFDDLTRICSKLTRDHPESRARADLYDEHARDSLREMYCGNGFAYRRFFLRENMTEAQQRLTSGLEYLQPYMRAMDVVLGIDSVIRHAHSIEQEFRDMYPQYDNHTSDGRIAAASTVAAMMQEHAERSVAKSERTVFLSLKANAEQDIEMFQRSNGAHGDVNSEHASNAPDYHEIETPECR